MKKIYLAVLFLAGANLAFAQFGKELTRKSPQHLIGQKTFKHQQEIQAAKAIPHVNPNPTNTNLIGQYAGKEVFVGQSFYDLQTNSSVQNRIVNHGDGTLSVAWTMAPDPAWNDRGSGYNYFDGNDWGAEPAARLEGPRRTGWPSLNTFGNGSDVILSHFSPAPYDGNLLRKDEDGNWSEKDMGNMTGDNVGVLWPRSTTGGPDGNTFHAIAITNPAALSGAIYKGMDGHLLYYRSLDGGETFDKVDVVLPGIDSTQYKELGGDDYAIHANGNTVAVLLMAAWGDVKVIKSTDNGETWEEHLVYDFPLGPAYDEAIGYDETMWPNDTFPSNDGSGSVLVDGNGKVHVWYSEVAVTDDTFGDGTWSFFPGLNSINYWNEDMTEHIEIAGVLDEDGDGAFGVAANEYGNYFNGFASYPSGGMDADGNLYLVYSAISELSPNENAQQGNQHYRKLYVQASTDGGMTWCDPNPIITAEFSDEFFFSFIEAVFPSVAKKVDDHMHIIYQQDYEPGISLSGDEDDVVSNFMTYTAIPVSYVCSTVGTKEIVKPEQINFNVMPNPASKEAVLTFDMKESGTLTAGLYNAIGQKVVDFGSSQYPQGSFSKEISLSGIAKGTYVVKLQTDRAITAKLIVVE